MKVIDYSNLPARLPTIPAIAIGLLLDRCDAPGWLWGVMGTLLLALFILAIIKMVRQEEVKVFK